MLKFLQLHYARPSSAVCSRCHCGRLAHDDTRQQIVTHGSSPRAGPPVENHNPVTSKKAAAVQCDVAMAAANIWPVGAPLGH